MEQIKKFKLENLLLFFLLMLPFGNFPQLFNLGEDTGSIYLSLLIGAIFFLWLWQEKKLYTPRIFFNKALLLLIAFGIVLNITSIGKNFFKIREKILKIIKKLNWSDGFYRKDIGWRVIKK